MRLTEILTPANIKIPLVSKAKSDAIAELVQLLLASGSVTDSKKVLDAVLDREATRSTGIGNGLAIPHGKCAGIGNLVMAIGKPESPIEFQSIDGKPVTLIWMLVSPPDKTAPHISALARISKLMALEKFRKTLLGAQSSQEMFDIISHQESQM